MLSLHMQSLVRKDPLQSISLVVDNAKSHNESTTTLSCSQLTTLTNVVVHCNLHLIASSFMRMELESSRNPRGPCVLPPALDEDTKSPHKQGSFEALVESFLDCNSRADDNNPRVGRSGIRSPIKKSVSSSRQPKTPKLARSLQRAQSCTDMFAPPSRSLSRWNSDKAFLAPPPPKLSRWKSDDTMCMAPPPPPALSRWTSEPMSGSACMVPRKPSAPKSPKTTKHQSITTLNDSITALPVFGRRIESRACLLDDDDDDDLSTADDIMTMSTEMGSSTSSLYSSSRSLISISSCTSANDF